MVWTCLVYEQNKVKNRRLFYKIILTKFSLDIKSCELKTSPEELRYLLRLCKDLYSDLAQLCFCFCTKLTH